MDKRFKPNYIDHIPESGPFAGYIILQDYWICPIFTAVINSRTGKTHNILEIKYHYKKINDPDINNREEKQSAVKVTYQNEILPTDKLIALHQYFK